MNSRDWEARLCALNLALLAAHEVDSGFWREWELFRLPGGLPGFLLANLLLFVVAQEAFRIVLRGSRLRGAASALLASAGLAAAALHGAFLAAGFPQFREFASLSILGAWLVTSIAQWVLIVRNGRAAHGRTAGTSRATSAARPVT